MKLSGLGLFSVALAISLATVHGATLLTTTADAAVNGPNGNPQDANGTAVANTTLATARAGSNTAATPVGRAYVIPFQLPTLAAGQTFSTASLTVFYAANGGAGGQLGVFPDGVNSTFNTDLYGLTNHASNSAAVLTTDYFMGTSDITNATLLQDNFLTPGTAPADATAFTSSGNALTSFLNSQYSLLGAGAYVFLRLNADGDTGTTGNYAYNFFTFDQGTVNGSSVVPSISYGLSAVPEPPAYAVMLLGLGALLGLQRFRRSVA